MQEQFEQIVKLSPPRPDTKYMPELGILLYKGSPFSANCIPFTAIPKKVEDSFNGGLMIEFEGYSSKLELPTLSIWIKRNTTEMFGRSFTNTYFAGYEVYHQAVFQINNICYDRFFNELPKHSLKLDPMRPYSGRNIMRVTNIGEFTFFVQSPTKFHYIEKPITPNEYDERYYVLKSREQYYLVSDSEYYELKTIPWRDVSVELTFTLNNTRFKMNGAYDITKVGDVNEVGKKTKPAISF